MDFNPVGGSTAPLLFDWDELGYGESTAEHACCKIQASKYALWQLGLNAPQT